MTDLLEVLTEAKENLMGPYGVTWYTDDHAIAHTGFVFTRKQANQVALDGPWEAEKITQVDGLCDHYPEDEGVQIWAEVETDGYLVVDQFYAEVPVE
jgi:hypothetical protein